MIEIAKNKRRITSPHERFGGQGWLFSCNDRSTAFVQVSAETTGTLSHGSYGQDSFSRRAAKVSI